MKRVMKIFLFLFCIILMFFVLAAAPSTTLSSPADASTDTDGNVTFQCNVTDDNGIQNISLYTNYPGSWTLDQTLSKGSFGESGDNINATVSFNGASTPSYATTSSADTGNGGNHTLNGVTGDSPNYWQPSADATSSNPEWIKIVLNDSYEINGVYQDFHSDGFTCQNYTISVSNDDVTYTNVTTITGFITGDSNDTFTPTVGKYVLINCTGTDEDQPGVQEPAIYEIEVYGQKLSPTISYNASYNKTMPVDGTYNWSCLSTDIDGQASFATTNRSFTIFSVLDNPNTTLSSPADASTDTDGNVTFQCNVTDDNGIQNISLYTNYPGSWTLDQTLSKGSFGESGDNINATVSFNGASTPSYAETSTGTKGNKTLDGNTGDSPNYWQPSADATPSSPQWIKIFLNDSYEINGVYQDFHSDGYTCQNYTISVSNDDVTYTNVTTITGFTTGDSNDTFTPTVGKYIIINCTGTDESQVGSAEPAIYEIQIYGQELAPSTSYNATFNKTSIDTDGTYNWSCLSTDIDGQAIFATTNRSFTIDNPIKMNNLYQYPLNISAGNTTYVYANVSSSGFNNSQLNVTIQYKSNSSSTWLDATEEYLTRKTIYSIGDSITAGHPNYDPNPAYYGGDDPINSSYEYWLDYNMNSNGLW